MRKGAKQRFSVVTTLMASIMTMVLVQIFVLSLELVNWAGSPSVLWGAGTLGGGTAGGFVHLHLVFPEGVVVVCVSIVTIVLW